MTYDEVLDDVGGFGKFQRRIIALLCIPTLAQGALVYMQVFIAGRSDHWCDVSHWRNEDCRQWNLTGSGCMSLKRNLSTPWIEGSRSKCTKYNVTGQNLETAFENYHYFSESNIIKCDDGWKFDKSVFADTILEEWELVCDKAAVSDIFQSVFFAGYLIGSIVFGVLADKIGRYYTFMIANVLSGVCGVLTAVSPHVVMFVILRFLTAAASYGTSLMCFVIASELVEPSHRVWTSVIIWIGFGASSMCLAGLASLISNWRLLIAICTLPYLAMIISYPFLTESPRWLIARERYDEAAKIVRKMAETNGTKVPEDIKAKFVDENELAKEKATASAWDLVRVPTIRWYMVSLLYNWFVHGLVFYGISLGTSALGVNVYIAFCLTGSVEIPSIAGSIVLMRNFGRRRTMIFLLLTAGMACFATIPAPPGPWKAAIAIFGKFAISMSFLSIYVFSGEVLPTPLRSFGVGSCSVAARVGGIVAPLLLFFGTHIASLPMIMFASSSVIGALLILILPETSGKALPDTSEDSVNLRKKLYRNLPEDDERKEAEVKV